MGESMKVRTRMHKLEGYANKASWDREQVQVLDGDTNLSNAKQKKHDNLKWQIGIAELFLFDVGACNKHQIQFQQLEYEYDQMVMRMTNQVQLKKMKKVHVST